MDYTIKSTQHLLSLAGARYLFVYTLPSAEVIFSPHTDLLVTLLWDKHICFALFTFKSLRSKSRKPEPENCIKMYCSMVF